MKKLLFIIMVLPVMIFGRQVKTTYYPDGLIHKDGDPIGDSKPQERLRINSDSTEIKFGGNLYKKSNSFTNYQNFFVEWRLYLKDCNELVTDTVEQSGTVKCELVPVKIDGKVTAYATQPKDTIWEEYECNEYKFHIASSLHSYNGTGTLFTTSGTVSVGYSSDKSYLPSSKALQKYSITRKVVCQIKKRKASFEDFFTRWCVEKKLIEFN